MIHTKVNRGLESGIKHRSNDVKKKIKLCSAPVAGAKVAELRQSANRSLRQRLEFHLTFTRSNCTAKNFEL